MRNESHDSWIKVLRTEVEAYRIDMGWSREAVVDRIVSVFNETEGSHAWGIEFSNHPDTFQRQKNNADKVYRWLNDFEKDNNLLNFNFAKVILQALPMQNRLRASAKLMVSIGLSVGMPDLSEDSDPDHNDIAELAQHSGNSVFVYSRAVADPTPENLEAAELQLIKEDKLRTRLRKKLQGAMSRKFTSAKKFINRVTQGKVAA